MNIKFINNISTQLNESLYNINKGLITFNNTYKYSATITKKRDTLFIENITLFVKDHDILQRSLEVIFEAKENIYKDIRVIERDSDKFYNIGKGESLFCSIKFTFENDIRQKYFDVLINNN